MPTYEYRCIRCGEHLEVFQSFSDKPLKKHSGCGGRLEKVFGSVGIVLKGSGFYRTDSRSAARASAEKSESNGADSKAPAASEASKSSEDTKADSKGSGSPGSPPKDSKGAKGRRRGSTKPEAKSA
jgi:putative FmdB family regulatory protein